MAKASGTLQPEKVISALALETLKEALCSIYWYKSGLRSFLQNSISDSSIVASADWTAYKRQIVSDIVDNLASNQAKYLGDIRKLFREVSQMENFTHLSQLEDGKAKVDRAKKAVADLRRVIQSHDETNDEAKRIEERRRAAATKLNQSQAVQSKLAEINQNYLSLLTTDPINRGFKLEKLLYDLFLLFDLDPKASFRCVGEQIDGAFSLEGTDYLFEGKWQQQPTDIQDLDAFASKVKRRLENTLGLFLSINGFSPLAIQAHSSGQAVQILMTGADLMAVLEGRIDFVSLLLRKRRHAAQDGGILLTIDKILLEN